MYSGHIKPHHWTNRGYNLSTDRIISRAIKANMKKTLLLLSILTFCWCGSVSAAEPIKLGGTLGLTGKYAPMSEMVSLGLQLWTKKTNAGGGILGRPVERIIYDDTSSPAVAGKLYEKLILEDKVRPGFWSVCKCRYNSGRQGYRKIRVLDAGLRSGLR